MQPRKFIKRHSLVVGVALMFLLTWPIDLANSGLMPFQVPFPVYLFLGWGFVFASIIMTWVTLGREAVLSLLKRFLIWRVGWKWYAAAFLLYPAIRLGAIAATVLLSGQIPDSSRLYAANIFGESANLWLFVLPFFLVDAIANGEEIGWRGYVLPRFQAQYNALVSSLILGVIWGFWHIPRYLGDGIASSFGLSMIRIIADAILYTWLFNNTRGSLLLVTIFHAAENTAFVFLPTSDQISFAVTVCTWIVALAVIMRAGLVHLSRQSPVQEGDVQIKDYDKQSVESFT